MVIGHEHDVGARPSFGLSWKLFPHSSTVKAASSPPRLIQKGWFGAEPLTKVRSCFDTMAKYPILLVACRRKTTQVNVLAWEIFHWLIWGSCFRYLFSAVFHLLHAHGHFSSATRSHPRLLVGGSKACFWGSGSGSFLILVILPHSQANEIMAAVRRKASNQAPGKAPGTTIDKKFLVW